MFWCNGGGCGDGAQKQPSLDVAHLNKTNKLTHVLSSFDPIEYCPAIRNTSDPMLSRDLCQSSGVNHHGVV